MLALVGGSVFQAVRAADEAARDAIRPGERRERVAGLHDVPDEAIGRDPAHERAGLAGLHLEDQTFPKRCGHLAGKALVSPEEMVEKIRAAVSARRDADFLIVARTDARAVENLDSAVRRARSYLKAGADAIFPEALESARDYLKVIRADLADRKP